jgi:hypothetical protein
VLLLACRGRSARGVADVVAASYGRRLATSTTTASLDQCRERDEFLHQVGAIDPERRSRERRGRLQPPPRPAAIYSSSSSSPAAFSLRLGDVESL